MYLVTPHKLSGQDAVNRYMAAGHSRYKKSAWTSCLTEGQTVVGSLQQLDENDNLMISLQARLYIVTTFCVLMGGETEPSAFEVRRRLGLDITSRHSLLFIHQM